MQAKAMLIEQDPRQTRVAVLEGERVAEVYHEPHSGGSLAGQVFKGRVHRVLPGMQAAFIDIGLERDAFLHAEDVRPWKEEAGDEVVPPSIEDLLKPGQELVVQVVKGPLANKGARVTGLVTLPGRRLVYLPMGGRPAVSRRIESEDERERLRELLPGLAAEGGFIARTAAEGCGREELEPDARRLVATWRRIDQRAAAARAPDLLHRDLGVALGAVRDLFDESFAHLWVDGEELHREVVDFVRQMTQDLANRVHRSDLEEPLFQRWGVDEAIEAALRPRVWLKSGGYLVIQPTEALVAIDVNTGRNVGKTSLQETILQTNLEAVDEAARQIRLRNLSGILVLDLIDMEDPEDRQRVHEALEEAVARDRIRTQILSISEFGLVEITRKRSRPSLYAWLTEECPECRGRARVHAPSFVADRIRRAALDRRPHAASFGLRLRVHPTVAAFLADEGEAVLEELESFASQVVVDQDPTLHREQFEIGGI